MRLLLILGLLLVGLGIFALAFQGFTFVTQDKVVDLGPLQVFKTNEHTVWLPPVLGVSALIVGVLLIFLSRKPAAS
jgi:hypothetical protein